MVKKISRKDLNTYRRRQSASGWAGISRGQALARRARKVITVGDLVEHTGKKTRGFDVVTKGVVGTVVQKESDSVFVIIIEAGFCRVPRESIRRVRGFMTEDRKAQLSGSTV